MNYEETLRNIERYIEKNQDEASAYQDYFEIVRAMYAEDQEKARDKVLWLRGVTQRKVQELNDGIAVSKFFEINKKTYLLMAKDDFDSYCVYLEWNREKTRRFYVPRRRVLRPLVQDLQDLNDGKLDFLGVSLPPRVGKSTLCIFFMTWIMGKRPEVANVMSGHSDKLTDGFYREVMNILTDKTTYLWGDVFPDMEIVDNSAKNETVDLVRKKRFPTFTARSIGGTLTGAVEVGTGGCLYVDDLVEDLEESLNPVRLQAKYDAYLNQLKDRKKDGAFELMVGTRWNVADPLGRIEEQYSGNPRYRFRVIPALNEDGESNFDYQYGLGFTTEYYKDMKASIDDATWSAKYQGKPYVREGLLFPAEALRYYNGVLPETDFYKVAVCDVAWGGGDSLSMPFAYVTGDGDVYIHDVIFSKGSKDITQPMIVNRTKEHTPHKERFEANNGGGEFAAEIDRRLSEIKVRTNITTQRAPNNQSKVGRIIQYSPEIKRFYFIDKEHRTPEYDEFMREVCTFSQTGKNPHDDAPDSLAMLADELYHGSSQVEVRKRLF